MKKNKLRRALEGIAGCALAWAGAASATDLDFGAVTGTLKNTVSIGVGVRTEKADDRLLGKLNVPGQSHLCPDGCISFAGDPAPNQRLVNAKGGYFGAVKDNGDMNFHQWGFTSGYSKLSSDLTLNWEQFTFKLGALGFFDGVNYFKDQHHNDTNFQPATTGPFGAMRIKTGRDIELKDAFVAAKLSAFDHDFNLSAGYLHLRWGESNFFALNSLNEINPPDARLLHQPGTPINEVFRPTPLLLLNTQIADGLALDLLYQLAWVPVQPDPQGGFNSFVDIVDGTNVPIALSQFSEDPDGRQRLPAPANFISNTSLRGGVINESFGHPNHNGQFGGKLTWYAADFNGGTEFGFYALYYHSRLPYVSVTATAESCARNSVTIADAVVACNGFKLNRLGGKEPLPIDTFREYLDYPQNIQLYGVSFNTNVGKWSLAGEYSFRPNLPLQVHVPDLVFAALQPAFPRRDISIPGGVAAGLAFGALQNPSGALDLDPQRVQGLLDYLAQHPTAPAIIPGGRNALPDYIEGYRGFQTQPGQIIHGYERFAVDEVDITAIRALGESDNPIGADQVIFLAELGFTHIWGLPSRDRLQLEGGDNNNSHHSPGADGSGNGGVPDTRRFNPHQQVDGFASGFAWGYRLWLRSEYDNLVLGLNFKPSLFFGQDVSGIGPQPMQNFIAGNKIYVLGTEVEAGGPLSGQVFYQGSTGGGSVNTQRDRDIIGLSVSYTF